MKSTLLSLLAAITAPLAFGQQSGSLPPLVSTTGSAEIRVVPDLADLYFEVEVRNADLTLARKDGSERAAKVLAALRAAGIAEAELQVSAVQITPHYTDDGEETEQLKFYRVSQSISCTLRELTKVPDVIGAAVAAGATGVRGASLRTSEARKYRDEARAKAVGAAKEKATALATELGVKVGKPYTITEGSSYDGGSSSTRNLSIFAEARLVGEASEGGMMPAFAPGTIGISANVSVSFLIE